MSTSFDDQVTAAPSGAEHAHGARHDAYDAHHEAHHGARHDAHDAHRDVLLAVQRGLAANWDDELPRIAVVDRDGVATVYVSTVRTLEPSARLDIRGAVRAALAPYTSFAPFTNVVFLRRGA